MTRPISKAQTGEGHTSIGRCRNCRAKKQNLDPCTKFCPRCTVLHQYHPAGFHALGRATTRKEKKSQQTSLFPT